MSRFAIPSLLTGLTCIVLLATASPLLAASQYDGLPESFFDHLSKGDADQAVALLAQTNPWVGPESDQIVNLLAELSKLDRLVGSYTYHELITKGEAGTRFAHLVFIVGYERQPVRFELQLYRPGESWIVHGISFDMRLTDDIDALTNRNMVR